MTTAQIAQAIKELAKSEQSNNMRELNKKDVSRVKGMKAARKAKQNMRDSYNAS
jgi:hypothetical protein